MMYHIGLYVLNHHSEKSHSIMVNDLFDLLLNSFYLLFFSILLRILHLYSSEVIGL